MQEEHGRPKEATSSIRRESQTGRIKRPRWGHCQQERWTTHINKTSVETERRLAR